MEKLVGEVTIQDAKLLYDMNMISSDELAKFTKAKAVMVKNIVAQYNRYAYEQQFEKTEEEKGLPSNVIS